MALSAVLTAGGLALLSGMTRIVVVTIGLDAFIASFAAGVGGTGWLNQGEVFPSWQSGVGLAWIMICFAALCVMAIVFVLRFLPETKGHSVEEIIRLFERQAADHADPRARPATGPESR